MKQIKLKQDISLTLEDNIHESMKQRKSHNRFRNYRRMKFLLLRVK